jgi:Zn-dependent protease with chaperone function
MTAAVIIAVSLALIDLGLLQDSSFGVNLEIYGIWLALGATLLLNFISWLIGPAIQDFTQNWVYEIKVIDIESLRFKTPKGAKMIESVCREFNYSLPKIKLIEDNNPTAFCFGSARYNARLVISEGLFTYLTDDEVEAVLAHEMGHITKRDFVIMTIASTLIQLMYQIHNNLKPRQKKSSDNENNSINIMSKISWMAYVFYLIGTYIILFLSRVREYGADEFAAKRVENPNNLSKALIKIAYGILDHKKDKISRKLMDSTRGLGIIDHTKVNGVGVIAKEVDAKKVSQVFLFDKVSPWAKLLEFSSSHPLTGKRIDKLSQYAKNKGISPLFDLEQAKQEANIDYKRLWGEFLTGFLFYYAPLFFIIPSVYLGYFHNPLFFIFVPGAMGLGVLSQIIYQFPLQKPAEQSTVLDCMANIYASPIRGDRVLLKGTVIGKGNAGAKFNEDIVLQDSTGLLYLNYESIFGPIGNFFSSFTKMKKLIGSNLTVTGWFFRGTTQHMDISTAAPENAPAFSSYPRLRKVVCAIILIGISAALTAYFEQQIHALQLF